MKFKQVDKFWSASMSKFSALQCHVRERKSTVEVPVVETIKGIGRVAVTRCKHATCHHGTTAQQAPLLSEVQEARWKTA